MNQAWVTYLNGHTAGESGTIAVMPFNDIHGYQPEPLLPYGVPFIVYDMFSGVNPVVHPYVSQAVVRGLGIAGDGLADPANAKVVAEKLGARFVVFGSVQRVSESDIRVIVDLFDAKSGMSVSPAAQFTAQLNDAFFSLMRQRLSDAFRKAKTSIRPGPFKDPSIASFRYYVRGLQLAETYDATSLDLAALWFEKALKENYQRYDDAALGQARAYFMMALIQKLNKSDFTQNMLKGRRVLKFLESDRRTTKYGLVTRYPESLDAFVMAATALRAGNASMAAKESERARALVPEDGMTEEIYARAIAGTKIKPAFAPFHPVCL
jgi:TolB-like protein